VTRRGRPGPWAALHPVVAVYATIPQAVPIDQVLIETVALHRLPVHDRAIDRAGVTGPDGGSSHNGMWDGSILQVVPGLRIAALA